MPRDLCRIRLDRKLEIGGVLVFRMLYQHDCIHFLGGTMNSVLIKLVSEYEARAERTKGKSFLVSEFYRRAANQILALAMQP